MLPAAAIELDAWTRDDRAANAWYQANHFTAEQHYLHVYKSCDDSADHDWLDSPRLRVIGVFMHASVADEDEMRRRFRRVHVCRRYVRPLRR